jgi:hypothetical protein
MSRHKQAAVRPSKPKRHHLDRRVKQIIAVGSGDHDDDLLTTAQVADWFGVSVQWLEIGRVKNYGPKFKRIGPHCVRYGRGDCLKFLKARTYASTAEYGRQTEVA